MSDTPIMDAVDAKCDELGVMDAICYAVYEGQKLEEKLNEANDRIKRLEEALTWYESKAEDCNRHGSEGVAARDALANDLGRIAKEAKL